MKEQYIFKREQRTNFTTVSNEIFDTDKLSLTAIGLACFLVSKPCTWEIRLDQLARSCKEAEGAIRRAMKELAEAGYLMRERERDADGTVRTVTRIADYPKFIDVGTPEQRLAGYGYESESTDPPENRGSVKPRGRLNRGSVNRGDIVNTDSLVKTELVKTESYISTDPTPQQEMFGAICEAIGWDYNTLSKDDKGQVAQAVGVLNRASYTVADVRSFMVDVWFNDWRWKDKGQHPTLKQLRQEIGKIRSVVKDAAPAPKTKGLQSWERLASNLGVGT